MYCMEEVLCVKRLEKIYFLGEGRGVFSDTSTLLAYSVLNLSLKDSVRGNWSNLLYRTYFLSYWHNPMFNSSPVKHTDSCSVH